MGALARPLLVAWSAAMIGDAPKGRHELNAVVNPEGIYLAVGDRPLILLDAIEADKLVVLLQNAARLHRERFVAWGPVSGAKQ